MTAKKVKAKGPEPTATYLAIKKRQSAKADAAAKEPKAEPIVKPEDVSGAKG